MAYCPQCSPKFQAEVSVRCSHPRLWYMYARVDWPDKRGRVKYNTLRKSRKREVRTAMQKYKVGWDKEYEDLTKERAEFIKASMTEEQMADAYHHD